jgi:hypothetical protein
VDVVGVVGAVDVVGVVGVVDSPAVEIDRMRIGRVAVARGAR